MNPARKFLWPSIALAAAVSLGAHAAGAQWWVALAIFAAWSAMAWIMADAAVEVTVVGEHTNPSPAAVIADSMSAMIEHSGTPLLLTRDSRITVANRAARSVLGDHVLGQDPRVALRHPDAIALMDSETHGEAIVTGLARRRDIWRVSRHVLDEDYAVIELLNRTSEADIGRAHTDFVANASHELRTPLASIIGYVETLSENPDDLDSATATRFLDTIHREARRLQSLVNDLMSLSRIEAEKHEQPGKRIDYSALVERASLDAAGAERKGRLDFAILPAIEVAGDAQQLEQMVRNLVDNAMKYGATDGPVTVAVDIGPQGNARLIVSDTGEGIPAEHLPHLTRRFYRTDPGRSRASGGTGLGLAIVKHIVERHRGRLDIDSTTGAGTTVTIRIPRYAEPEEARDAA